MHSGTAQGGHYFSHIKVEDEEWQTFNDTTVRSANADTLIDECCGGERVANLQDAEGVPHEDIVMNTTSAYLLFDRKVGSTHELMNLCAALDLLCRWPDVCSN
jgi:hypothetical protein